MSDKDIDIAEQKPAAGCMNCSASAWVLVLDAYPPHHTTIVQLVCPACHSYIDVYIPLDKVAPREAIIEGEDNE